MKDQYGYSDGCCLICHEETKVRWKNLYVIGSEGINVCHTCEMKIIRFIEAEMRGQQQIRKQKYLLAREERRAHETIRQHETKTAGEA